MEANEQEIQRLPKEMFDDFPQLREKTVLDVVNGLEVLRDRLRWRDEDPSSFVSRAWGGLTGGTARNQHALDRGVQGVLKGVNEWLNAIQEASVQSDIAIERVTERLLETRRFVMRLACRHNALQKDLTCLDRRISAYAERTERQLSELREELRKESSERRAWNAVERMESRWKSERYDPLPALARTVLAADGLYWGDFGAFLRLQGTDEREADDLCGHARDVLGNMARGFLAEEHQDFVIVEDCLASLDRMQVSADWKDAAAYLVRGSPQSVQPLAAAVENRLEGRSSALPDTLPRLMRPAFMGELAVREVERRIVVERQDGEGSL